MNLMELFDRNVKNHPNIPALSMSGRNQTWTYQELSSKVNQATAYFRNLSIQKGDGVLILVPMSFELYTTLLALFKLGAVAVFIDPQSSKKHINACIKKYPLKAFIGVKKAHLLRLINKDIREIPLHITMGYLPFTKDFNKYYQQDIREFKKVNVDDNDPALITFTSGSTGNPKAAVRTHAFLLKQYEVLSKNMLFNKGEVDISTLPVFVLANLAAGMHSVIPDVNLLKPAEVNGDVLLEDIKKYKATRFGGSPTLVDKITQHINNYSELSLTHVYLGGGPVYPKILKGLQEKLPKSSVYGLYGSTEAEPIAHTSSFDYDSKKVKETSTGNGLYVGDVVEEIKVKIVDGSKLKSHMAEIDTIICEHGEILVNGDHVLKGYLNGEGDEENKVNVKGEIWHRTGDAGYFDEQGKLWILGRYSQRIITGSKVIYPFAVEAALFDKGYQAAVVVHNNEPCIVVETKMPDEDVLKSVGISKVLVVEKIPRDQRHNAKVDYGKLKDLIKSK